MNTASFEEATRHRSCVLIYANTREDTPGHGTGMLLQHSGELFVLTCAHVACDFLSYPVGEIAVLSRAQRIQRTEVEIVHRDKDLDVQVLRVRPAARLRLDSIRPLALSDLGDERAYRNAVPSSEPRYCVIGFPGDDRIRVVDDEKKQIHMNPLLLVSMVLQHEPERLLLDYRHGLYDGEPLPPSGISGSLVFEIAEGPSNEMIPGRIVAMQTSWSSEHSVLSCSPVHQLRTIIERAAGTLRK